MEKRTHIAKQAENASVLMLNTEIACLLLLIIGEIFYSVVISVYVEKLEDMIVPEFKYLNLNPYSNLFDTLW